jgi:hypothetical protein
LRRQHRTNTRTVRDIKDAWVRVRMNPSLDEAGKKAAADTYLTKDLKEWCGKLEKSLGVFKGAPQCAGAIAA